MNKQSYSHHLVEKKWYGFWLEHHLFEPINKKTSDKNFSIILPPPNVTGKLHLGHAFDSALQDCMIRYKKLCGFRTIWIPGTDHAGIATQTKFEKILKQKNVDPHKLSRDKFTSMLMEWSKNQSDNIHQQWSKLGLALSYKNEVYTLDDDVKQLVKQTFTKMYKDNLIYRGYKLVNWDVILQTAISDIEIIYKKSFVKLYYIKYFLKDSNEYLTIATTRPETIYVDCCVFVNPNDKRYSKYINKYVINPLNKKELKILSDHYIDKNFGTGVMKCTPAHDFNDYKLADKHKITNYSSVFNLDGTLNENGLENKNIDRFAARKNVIELLKSKNYLLKQEEYETQIAFSERTDSVVEPMLSLQWFVKMQPIAKTVISLLKRQPPTFLPKRFEKTLIAWLKNINDWCISRQLVWGHRIPVYYDNKDKLYIGDKYDGNKNLKQDNDVLDTWFSSGLWPIALTLNKPHLKDFYPINMLVTGYDILFFWVARMLFQCAYLTNKISLKTIYFHGLIRDEQNRKMSKSLGNGIDPMQLIEETGCDSLRLFLISTSTIGDDLRFSREKIKYYWSFINKLWNAHNFLSQFKYKINKLQPKNLINRWIINEFNSMLIKVKQNMDKYNFVIANKYLIDFVWETYCNQYLELIRIDIKAKNNQEIIYAVNLIFKNILIMLHPTIPFVSEEIYQNLYKNKISIMLENYPNNISNIFSINDKKIMNVILDIFHFAKNLRIKHNLKNTQEIIINVISKTKINIDSLNDILKVVNVKIENISINRINQNAIIHSTLNCLIEYFENFVDVKTQLINLNKQLEYLNNEIKRSQSILANINFINKAPKEKINLEKQKYENYQKQHQEVLSAIKALQK